MPPIEENIPRREFQPRRRRTILSFRRKRDLAWFLVATVPFVIAVTLLVFKVKLRKPVIVERPAEAAAETR
jgi:hypothetical protein